MHLKILKNHVSGFFLFLTHIILQSVTDRDLAWLLYDVANYYYLDDMWHREIVIEKLNIPNSIIERLRSDVPDDIMERKYCIFKKWMQRTGVCKRYCCFHLCYVLW